MVSGGDWDPFLGFGDLDPFVMPKTVSPAWNRRFRAFSAGHARRADSSRLPARALAGIPLCL